MSADQLPWQHRGGTGVCLSGGGIRAAAFALGALQALQDERGLLFGERSAQYIAAVSGGSYTAAAFALTAKRLERDDAPSDTLPPLHPDSPEAQHILRNGDYLKRWGRTLPGRAWWWVTIGVVVAFGAFNLMGFVSLFVLTGAMIAGVGEALRGPLPDASSGAGWALGVLAAGGLWLFVRLLYVVPRSRVWLLVALLCVAAGAGALMDGSRVLVAWLDGRTESVGTTTIVAGIGVAALYLLLSLSRLRPDPVAEAAGALSTLVPRLVGLVALAVSIDVAARSDLPSSVLIVGSVVLGALLTTVLSRVSLHRLNRDRIAHGFAVVRDGSVASPVPRDTALSSIAPDGWPQGAFPRLLICATANVRRRSGQWAGTFEPFTFSHDLCWLPRDRAARYATRDLERLRRPAGLGSEPTVTLMTAVASAGAAVSPSMGAMTRPGLRSVLALINLRLGAWLPNPVSAVIRDEVGSRDGGGHRHLALGRGYDEFVPELLGIDNDDAPRIYVSDGGHYDNLGLLMLLRARCREIWCVDAQADRHGRAGQLRHVVALALAADLVAGIAIDLDAFATDGRWLPTTHAIGHISYPDGSTGRLIVVKLGLTADSAPTLRAYHDRGARWTGPLRSLVRFPHDNTFLRVAFGERRMCAYRLAGYENTVRASVSCPDAVSVTS